MKPPSKPPRGPNTGPSHGPRPPRDRAFGPRPATPRPPSERSQRAEAPHAAAAPTPDRPVREPLRLATAPRPESARPESAPFVRTPRGREEPRRAPGAAETPKGTVWLYGAHAVAAALANPSRRLRRLVLTEEAEAALATRLRQPWPVGAERVERSRLDQLLGRDVVHQGIALLADPLTPPPLAQALERSGPVLVLDQVSDPRNTGAILRSAAAFGAACVIVQERNAPEESGALAKAASGALELLPMLRAVNIARTIIALKAAGCWTVGLDAGGPPLSGPALSQRRVALVLGSEGEGLRRLTRDTCDERAGLAMRGGTDGLDSLNVSAAAAVALYELNRR